MEPCFSLWRLSPETHPRLGKFFEGELEMLKTIYATFADKMMAENAAGALLDHGADPNHLSIVSKNVHGEDDLRPDYNDPAHSPALTNPSEVKVKEGITTTTPQDAGAGAIKGAEIGLGVGAVAALASLLVPGVGIVIGGGALAIALAGAAGVTAAGAAAGGVAGYLGDQGAPQADVKEYHTTYENGGAVLSIHIPSGKIDQTEAEAILAKYHAGMVRIYGDPNG